MAEIKWIKLSTDIFKSRKFLVFDRRKDRDSVELLWIKLLTLAAEINDGGRIYVTESIPHTMDTLSSVLLRPVQTVRTAMELFEQFGMIKREGGFISITNWDKYQNVEKLDSLKEYNRQAKRKSREKRRLVNDVSMTVIDNVNPRGEEEKEKEKEIRKDWIEEREKDATASFSLPSFPKHFVSFDDEDDRGEDTRVRAVDGPLGRGLVMLSDRQEAALLERLSVEEYDHYLNVIATQIEKGKSYGKSHYRAILDMVAQDRAIEGR